MRLFGATALLLTLVGVAPAVSAEETLTRAAAVPVAPASQALTAAEVAQRVDDDLPSLGALSVGQPHSGALINGVQMQDSDAWKVMQPATGFATQETIDSIARAALRLQREFPGSHKLFIGDLAREGGGHLRPHASHQSGRDADISYYYRPGYQAWYQPASIISLDKARSWSFVRALLTETDVELIFIDMRVQRLLYDYALSIGEDRAWLDSVFGFRMRSNDPIIRHEFGHTTHMHVRFYNPEAQRRGQFAFDRLVERKIITQRHYGARLFLRSPRPAKPRAEQPPPPMRGQMALADELVIPPRRLPPTAQSSAPALSVLDGPPHAAMAAAAAAPR